MTARPAALPFETSSSIAGAPFVAPRGASRRAQPLRKRQVAETLDALESESSSIRFEALIRLGETLSENRAHDSVCPYLLHRLESPALSKDERRATLWALAQARSNRLTAKFRRRLLSKDERVALDAAFFVGCSRDRQSSAVLALTLLQHPVASMARTVIWALGSIGGEDAESTVLMLLDQRVYETECVSALGNCGGSRAAAAVAPYVLDLDAGRRRHALHALAEIAERAGLPPALADSLSPHLRACHRERGEERELAARVERMVGRA